MKRYIKSNAEKVPSGYDSAAAKGSREFTQREQQNFNRQEENRKLWETRERDMRTEYLDPLGYFSGNSKASKRAWIQIYKKEFDIDLTDSDFK